MTVDGRSQPIKAGEDKRSSQAVRGFIEGEQDGQDRTISRSILSRYVAWRQATEIDATVARVHNMADAYALKSKSRDTFSNGKDSEYKTAPVATTPSGVGVSFSLSSL